MPDQRQLARQALLLYDALNDRSFGAAYAGERELSNRLCSIASKAFQRYVRRYNQLTTPNTSSTTHHPILLTT
jgi:hypothetical protein